MGAWREAAMALRVAPGQEKQESQESKEEEDTELHDPRPAAFHPTAALSWAFYLETTSATSYVTSAVPCHPFIIVQECELERSPKRPTLPSQVTLDVGRNLGTDTKVHMNGCVHMPCLCLLLWGQMNSKLLFLVMFGC